MTTGGENILTGFKTTLWHLFTTTEKTQSAAPVAANPAPDQRVKVKANRFVLRVSCWKTPKESRRKSKFAKAMIKLQAIGHLGKDATVNDVNGKNVINFTVAHSEKFKDAQGNQKDKTTWVECAYWTDRTGIAPYLLKGTQVYVEGTPEVRTYPKNDGTTGVSLSCRVFSVQLLGSKQGGDNSGYANQSQASATPPVTHRNGAPVQPNTDFTEPIDDLPF